MINIAKKKHISAVISLKDNMSATLKGIRKEQNAFRKDVAKTKKEMEALSKKKLKARIDSTQASKAIKKLKKDATYLAAKDLIIKAVAKTERAKDKISSLSNFVKKVGKTSISPVIKVKDKATSVINKVKSGLSGLAKAASIPLAVGTATATMALKGGAELEQQQIAMKHFMGVGNKDKSDAEVQKMTDDYLKDLRDNANATPFETGEVIAAGARALQISGGDTKKAMEKVKLAEDMAALNPGKTISDAMEAIADMEVGEYARLTEFGVKGSKEDGDTPESLQKELQSMYSGGAEKLSSSATGLLSTITGKLKSNLADMGQSMLEPLKPVMTNVIGFVDQVTPKMLALGATIGQGIGQAVTFINSSLPTIQPIFQSVFSTLSSTAQTVMPVIGQAITALKPVFQGLLVVGQSAFNGICQVVQTVAPIISSLISQFQPVFNNVGTTLKNLGSIFSSVFDGIKNVVSNAYDFLKPVINGISNLVGNITGAISSVTGAIAGKLSGKKVDKNATGTKYFSGGLSVVGEHGPELVQMPGGSKVFTNRETNNILKPIDKPKIPQIPTNTNKESINNSKGLGNISSNQNFHINIAKIADSVVIREESDIEKITLAIVNKINESKGVVV